MSSSVPDPVALIGVVDVMDGTLRIHPDSTRERWLEIPRGDFVVEPYDEERSRVVVDEETLEAPVWDEEEVAEKLRGLEAMFAGAPFTVWNMLPETRLAAAIQMDLLEGEGGAQS